MFNLAKKQKALKGEIDKTTILGEDLNILLSMTDEAET